MMQRHWRVLEIITVMGLFAAFYLLVLGPFLGELLGLDRAMLSGPDDRPGGELPDTARGWLFVALMVPILLGYMLARARVAGTTMDRYWNEPFGKSRK